jgi:hypothetical protein
MFYKVRGTSKKTGQGTVYVIHRDEAGKETIKTTAVTVKPAYLNTKTGKIGPHDPLHAEKNERIQAVATEFETAIRNLKTNGLAPLASAVQKAVFKTQFRKATDNFYWQATTHMRHTDMAGLSEDLEVLKTNLKKDATIKNFQVTGNVFRNFLIMTASISS